LLPIVPARKVEISREHVGRPFVMFSLACSAAAVDVAVPEMGAVPVVGLSRIISVPDDPLLPS
jgi:hypothetical protein